MMRRLRLPSRNSGTPLAGPARTWVDNLLQTSDGRVYGSYRISQQRWDFTGTEAQRSLIQGSAEQWGMLVGHEVIEDGTAYPHPVSGWARRLDERNPHPVPDVHECDGSMDAQSLADGLCGCETWNRHLARMQYRIKDAGMDERVVIRHVHLGHVDPKVNLRDALNAFVLDGKVPPKEVAAVVAAERKVFRSVSLWPWNATRLSTREAIWLRQRSIARHVPAPALAQTEIDRWGAMDIAAPTDVRWENDPYDRWVKITAMRGGKRVVRYVQTLVLAFENDLSYPASGLEPWMVYSERLPYSVDFHLGGRIVTDLEQDAEKDLRKAQNVRDGYIEHEEIPPTATARGIARALEIRDEVSSGATNPLSAKRFRGNVLAYVSANDPDELEGRSEQFVRHYSTSGVGMQFDVPRGQAIRLAEAIPGAKRDTLGYQRQFDLHYLATAMPNISAVVGDGVGFYYGYTFGATRRPFLHDSHFATEGRADLGRGQNFWLLVATLGGGKSVFLDSAFYNNIRVNNRVVANDPSGPMRAIAEMPEIAPYCRIIDLIGEEPGTASIPALIREPLRSEYEPGDKGDERWRRASLMAAAERRNHTRDIARRFLEADLYEAKRTSVVFRDAARQVEWTTATTLWDFVDAVRAIDAELANALSDASEEPGISLMFAPRGQGGDFAHSLSSARATLITTAGIKRAPDGVSRHDWSPEERTADPLLRVANLLTYREIYMKPMYERCVAIFDEAETLTDSGTGRGTLARLGRDHSKWNVEVWLALKNFEAGMLGGGVSNYLAGALVGKMASVSAAEPVMDVLRIEDRRYARQLVRLSEREPGQFIHLDVEGRVGGVKIDVDYHPRLAEKVMTNPGAEIASDLWTREDTLG